MKTNYKISIYKNLILAFLSITTIIGCDDVLDITPPSAVSPEEYLYTPEQLAAYTIRYYADYKVYDANSATKGGQFGTFGTQDPQTPLADDVNTDNETNKTGSSNRFLPGDKEGSWKVAEKEGNWNFSNIYVWNFYLNTVVPRFEKGEMRGVEEQIKHYIGEGYFLRAQEYFYRLRKFGDFPIITEVLSDSKEELVEASKRKPRNEVARFILSDLEKAINLLLQTAPQGGKTRINKNAALLLKARVALFEGTWLKHHKGTAFVPKGEKWPGADKEYSKDYQFPTGSIDGEIAFFLEEAMKASEIVADACPLAENNGVIADNNKTGSGNSYYDMFASSNPTNTSEVIMARLYKTDVQAHWFNHYRQGGGMVGFTKQFEKSFLMDNGLPIYASGSGYAGDDLVTDTKTNRDSRWQLFMKAPGEIKKSYNSYEPTGFEKTYWPAFPNLTSSDGKLASSTGYISGKGYSLDAYMLNGGKDLTASVIFRSAEAYLIYLEACYEKDNSLDSKAEGYWKALRRRSKVDEDFNKTIAATDMNEEAKYDWAAYSAGALIDATLYNIRRERRCEFIGEGQRLNDLLRWRALDQLNGYQLEGCKIWGPGMESYYNGRKGVSAKELSEYMRPYQVVTTNNNFYDGLFFAPAHYLDPIAVHHFLMSSPDNKTPEESPIYQNPGWPLVSNEPADITVK